ncbi:MAG: response regulator transcription factor, partial [Lachnospiraceae bacterium]|nr:response regulator transcription factor [Lachnospiraceae bacterium]
LDCGGDDYVTKPFKIGELCSRIRALLRRTQNVSTLTFDNLSIDTEANRVTVYDRTIELTKAEYRLLCLLARNAGIVVTRERILDELWDHSGDFVDDNTLSVYVRRLREKIEPDPAHPSYLITVRGFGYKWNAQT